MMQITRKRIKINPCFIYSGGNGLGKRRKYQVSWVTITNDLRWTTLIRNIYTKANQIIGFLRRNLCACPQEVKEAAYKGRAPSPGNSGSVWDSSGVGLQDELEKVQNRTA